MNTWALKIFFLFGLEAHEVEARRRQSLDYREIIAANPALMRVCENLLNGHYSGGDTQRYRAIVDSLLNGDWFMVASDFAAYAKAQQDVAQLWTTPQDWTRKTILNTVRMGWFSSDRTITEYARDIWKVPTR